jgi:hypothetical protein
MWTRKHWQGYQSLFLLVRVRSGRFRLTLPVALFLFDETLEIFADWLWLVEKLIPVRIGGDYFLPHEMLGLGRELLGELRRHGRYSLVEVKTGTGLEQQTVLVELL